MPDPRPEPSLWTLFDRVSLIVPPGWLRDEDISPPALFPPNDGVVVQLSWVTRGSGETSSGLHMKVVGAVTHWYRREMAVESEITVVTTDYQFEDSIGVWAEAPHRSERGNLGKAFAIGMRAWPDGVFVITWLGPASEIGSLQQTQEIFGGASRSPHG